VTHKPKLLVVQSGGPTAVINASLCGVVQEAARSGRMGRVLGATNGILGMLRGHLRDLSAESPEVIEGLRRTPGAALGSSRYKLGSAAQSTADYEQILVTVRRHDVRYFLCIGGNDSMDTADKVGKLAAEEGYELMCVGIPKTVDNDLVCTDHCPGYGSAAKFVATSAMEAGRDTDALYTTDTCTILEVMGRNTGWMAAATGLAARAPQDAPHLIYMPETPLSFETLVRDVKEVLQNLGRVFVVVAEGVKHPNGDYIAADTGRFGTDRFGHQQLGGVADVLKSVIEREVGVKARCNKLGTNQRSAMHFASLTDVEEAWICGQMAVRYALAGENRKMVTLIRQPGEEYKCTTGLVTLSEVANSEKEVPSDFMSERRNHITDAMRDYVRPLVQGQAPLEIGPDGLPVFVRLKEKPLGKKLPHYP
jgi:6-phosphofructokinase